MRIAGILILFFSQLVLAQNNFLNYQVLNTYPHNPQSFTQGLILDSINPNIYYESTGLHGHSKIQKVSLQNGNILESTSLGSHFFGEGLAKYKDKFYQLTWKSRLILVYDKNLKLINRLQLPRGISEGWGLTLINENLVMSDGSDKLYFLKDIEQSKFQAEINRIIHVKSDHKVITMLNELEYAQGWIFANIWQSDSIAMINPHSGEVEKWLNLEKLKFLTIKNSSRKIDVLNGIAWDFRKNTFYITGKLWPFLYEIRITE